MSKKKTENPDSRSCDILIAGAGFAGSLTALALHQSGFNVCLVEKNSHPRFAIGESSTPIADMILRDLADTYSMPWLKPFSRYGSWQEAHPDIRCGIKRGFSYYQHREGKTFTTDDSHTNELLVAASASDERSDTNWMRSDFDHFLVNKVQEEDIPYYEQTQITGVQQAEKLHFELQSKEPVTEIKADFFVDATGGSDLISTLFNVTATDAGFLTNSRAIYTHFDGLMPWTKLLGSLDIPDTDYPYNPDNSALHHLLEEGWLWMLRFNTGRTSVGLLLDRNKTKVNEEQSPVREWASTLGKYPSLIELFKTASIAGDPGSLISTGRLQRRLSRAAGDRWVALPHSAGFVDPLHSTGIAHTLTGVEKVVKILNAMWDDKEALGEQMQSYRHQVGEEFSFVDLLVGGSYKAIPNFELFNIWSMFYFTAAINYEQSRLKGEVPSYFLCAGDAEIRKLVDKSFEELKECLASSSPKGVNRFRAKVRERIAPHNIAGLLDADAQNMYHHTVAEL